MKRTAAVFCVALLPLLASLVLAHPAVEDPGPPDPAALKQARFAAAAARPPAVPRTLEGIDLSYAPLTGRHPLQDESFYLLTLLEEVPGALQAITDDADMRALRNALVARAQAAAKACETEIARGALTGSGRTVGPQPGCTGGALRLTPAEREAAATALGRLHDRSPVIRRIVTAHMRPSGRFQRDAALTDRALLIQAWQDALEGMDRIVRVYALGEKARYADIDAPIYQGKEEYHRDLVMRALWEAAHQSDRLPAPWQVAMEFGLGLMQADRRDDAVRQLILQEEENKATMAYLSSVKWQDFPYVALTVPGWSPEIGYEPMNPGRKVELRLAVEYFKKGLAPYILVSGARLRPAGTLWTEGYEMKRYLVEELGFPADRVLISTINRHTPTEMRDHSRLIFRSGAPLGRKALVINLQHYIASPDMLMRCRRDFGYVPYTLGRWLDFAALEWTPSLASFQREATDPMNP